MALIFDTTVLSAVLSHMNGDHGDDNLLIAQAFGPTPDVVSATMTGFDGDGGDWSAMDAAGATTGIRVAWPGGPISERPEVRREIVALYDAACRALGIPPRPHA